MLEFFNIFLKILIAAFFSTCRHFFINIILSKINMIIADKQFVHLSACFMNNLFALRYMNPLCNR
jgi:hypothetical protein